MISFCPASERTRNTRKKTQSCHQGASHAIGQAPILRRFFKALCKTQFSVFLSFFKLLWIQWGILFLRGSSRNNPSIHILRISCLLYTVRPGRVEACLSCVLTSPELSQWPAAQGGCMSLTELNRWKKEWMNEGTNEEQMNEYIHNLCGSDVTIVNAWMLHLCQDVC